MVLSALLTGTLVLVAGLIVTFIALLRYQREKQAFLEALKLYFEAPNAETPSQFALLTEVVSERFSQKMVASLKSSFMGMQSVDAKNVGRLESDLLQDVASQQNPALGAILGAYPAVARRLAKNPSLLPLVQNIMAKVGAGGTGNNEQHSVSSQDIFAIK